MKNDISPILDTKELAEIIFEDIRHPGNLIPCWEVNINTKWRAVFNEHDIFIPPSHYLRMVSFPDTGSSIDHFAILQKRVGSTIYAAITIIDKAKNFGYYNLIVVSERKIKDKDDQGSPFMLLKDLKNEDLGELIKEYRLPEEYRFSNDSIIWDT